MEKIIKKQQQFESDNSDSYIRVLIVDDHEMVRRGLSDFLRVFKDFKLVGEASDGEEAITICKKTTPDVILMDLVMPKLNGVDATRTINRKFPKVKIIALSSYDDERLVPAALEAGAISFLQKNVTMRELADAIRNAMNDVATLSPKATQYLISAATTHKDRQLNLTARESEVLNLIVEGKSNANIAIDLGVALSTVKAHVSQVLNKLGVKNRGEAIVYALENDLVKKNKRK